MQQVSCSNHIPVHVFLFSKAHCRFCVSVVHRQLHACIRLSELLLLHAGYQLLLALGLCTDQPDRMHVLAWLEDCNQDRFGIVIAHAQELLTPPTEEQGLFLDYLDQMVQVSAMNTNMRNDTS